MIEATIVNGHVLLLSVAIALASVAFFVRVAFDLWNDSRNVRRAWRRVRRARAVLDMTEQGVTWTEKRGQP